MKFSNSEKQKYFCKNFFLSTNTEVTKKVRIFLNKKKTSEIL